jgi:hypothetical protein
MTYPSKAVDAAFALLPSKMDTLPARRILTAIGYQESKYLTRVQYGGGPAHSYWQFEKNGGVKGVMNFEGEVQRLARMVCEARKVPWDRQSIWEALAVDDTLGAAFTRLLMYTDAFSLPKTEEAAWAMYLRTWRPGKPHPATWPVAWAFGGSV